MNKNLHASTQALIQDIERKDRRFRIAQSIFLAAIMLFMAFTVALGYITLTSSQHQLVTSQRQTTELEKEVKRVDTDNAAKLQDLQNHIDCVVTLFTQPDRQNLTISDISTCQLQTTNSPSGATNSNRTTIAPAQARPAPATSNTPAQQTQPPANSTPAPAPHPMLCKATLGLFGCK